MSKTISKIQMGKYRAIWAEVKKALVELGDFSASDAEAERKAIHTEVLGSPKSSKDFTNTDLNKVLDAFDKILVIFNGPNSNPSRDAQSLIWAISQTGLPDPYLASISQDQFGQADWRNLPEDKLRKFRFTAVARAAAKRRSNPTPPPPCDAPV